VIRLATPPDLDADFWSQPDIVTAIEHGDLGQFLLAVRGARRPRWSQDQIAFWLCCAQSRISDLESGRAVACEARVDATFTALHVPGFLATRWATSSDRHRG
jgi:hypothetical protein